MKYCVPIYFNQYNSFVDKFQGVRKRFSNTLPPMRHPLAWIDANNIFRKIDELGSTVRFILNLCYTCYVSNQESVHKCTVL